MFFGNKEKDRLFLQYDESGTDLLIAVPGNAAEEAGPVISDQLQEEWKEKYPHVSAEHIPELADGYYNYSESIRLGYKDFYADGRNVM